METNSIPGKPAAAAVHPESWIAPGAVIVGPVTIHRGVSNWYNAVLRSDEPEAGIVVGEDSNIQDGCIVHVDENMPVMIGARVTVGHGAIIHSSVVEDDCLIGMGAIILSGARIGRGTIVAAGAVIPEGMEVPAGVIIAGVPGKVRRETTDADRTRVDRAWRIYAGLREEQMKDKA
jgi:carbonic anhydrase/acetyltransferase-like protein (isoleucine patch superfamily)